MVLLGVLPLCTTFFLCARPWSQPDSQLFPVTLVRLVRVLGRLQPQIDITNPHNALSNAMWDLSPLYTITK